MSAIGGIGHSPACLQQLANPANAGKAGGLCQASGVQRQGVSFAQSLQQALSQIGSGASTSSGNTQNAQIAIQSFLQQLLAALHQAGAGNASSHADGDGDGGTSAAASAGAAHAGHRHHHGMAGYNSTLQADLQGLLQQVSATASASDSGLQQSFQGMLSAMGANGTDTLSGFLQSIASRMRGSSLVSTTA